MTKRDAINKRWNTTANLQLYENGKMEVSTAAELLNVSPQSWRIRRN
jgi:hypothetical protein